MRNFLFILFSVVSIAASAQLAPIATAYPRKPVYSTATDYASVGTQGAGSISCSPVAPSTVNAGDLLLMAVGSKIRHAIVETPQGEWRRLDETMDHVGSSGGDVGEVRQTLFWMEADGTEDSKAYTVTCSNCNSMNAVIYSFNKDDLAMWELNVVSGSDQTAGTDYSVTSKGWLRSKPGDIVFVVSSMNTDLYAWTTEAIAQSGVSFSTINQEVGEYATAEGNDQEQIASVFRVTSASVVPAPFVYTATASSTAANNPLGTTTFVQIRQNYIRNFLPPSGYREWVAARAIDLTYSGDGSAIWDGMRTSVTQTGTPPAEKYSIETFNGRPCYKFSAILGNSSNYVMRAEVSMPCPWQPEFRIGTQILHEIRYETGPSVPTVWREWDILQNHTGTQPGGPYPLNSPLYYFCFAYAGQTGWGNLGGGATPASGGEFGIVITTTAPDIRFIVPSVTWQANTVYRIRHFTALDYDTGEPAIKVWVAVDDGDYDLVYENYSISTVFEDDDVATHGAPPHVGGAIKVGVYNHSVTNGTDAATSIAAGNSGYTLYVPAIKMAVFQPSDKDYVTDVTDNFNPVYDKVSTADY
jgi:hypothetical protein